MIPSQHRVLLPPFVCHSSHRARLPARLSTENILPSDQLRSAAHATTHSPRRGGRRVAVNLLPALQIIILIMLVYSLLLKPPAAPAHLRRAARNRSRSNRRSQNQGCCGPDSRRCPLPYKKKTIYFLVLELTRARSAHHATQPPPHRRCATNSRSQRRAGGLHHLHAPATARGRRDAER